MQPLRFATLVTIVFEISIASNRIASRLVGHGCLVRVSTLCDIHHASDALSRAAHNAHAATRG